MSIENTVETLELAEIIFTKIFNELSRAQVDEVAMKTVQVYFGHIRELFSLLL